MINARALSNARFLEKVELGEVLCARSIKPSMWIRVSGNATLSGVRFGLSG